MRLRMRGIASLLLQLRIERQADDRSVLGRRAVCSFNTLHAPQSFPPGNARLRTILNPADEIAELKPVRMVKAEIVKPLMVRLGIVRMLPVDVEVIQKRHEPYAA